MLAEMEGGEKQNNSDKQKRLEEQEADSTVWYELIHHEERRGGHPQPDDGNADLQSRDKDATTCGLTETKTNKRFHSPSSYLT